MKTLTIKEFVDDSENIIRRVEKGEEIAVTDGEVSAVLVPSDQYIYKINNSDGPWLLNKNFLYLEGQPIKAMTLTSKFSKDLSTLRAAANKEIYLDVKNPKLYKKVKRYYQNDIDLTGEDPERDYELVIECVRQDLVGVEVKWM